MDPIKRDPPPPILERPPSSTAAAKANWRKIFAARKFLSLARIQAKASPAQLLVKNQYQVGKKLNNGAFGQLRLGRDLHAKDYDKNDDSYDDEDSLSGPGLVAIKLEPSNSKIPMLGLEFKFYKMLTPHRGLPQVYHYGTCGRYNALVMELLGPNLEELFVACGRVFSLQTILLIAIQLLNRIEYVHSCGIIYRDIKPENCCIGRSSLGRANLLHLVDFGLAREYLDPDTGAHIPYREHSSLVGTVRYMSINALQGREQSRRDDLEALGHMFFYFLSNGRLPWQGVKTDDNRKRYKIVSRIKEETKISELGNPHPWEFSLYLRYCRSLKFNQDPDYSYLRNLFRSCMKLRCHSDDLRFDWEEVGIDGGSNLARVNSRGNLVKRVSHQNVLYGLQHHHQQEKHLSPRPRALLDEALLLKVYSDKNKSNESVVTNTSPSVRSGASKVTRVECLQNKTKDETSVRVETPANSASNKPVATVEPVPRNQQQLQQQHASPAGSLNARGTAANRPRNAMFKKRQTLDDEEEAMDTNVEVVNCKTCCYIGRISRRMSVIW